jgi:Uma2 family endonuclease
MADAAEKPMTLGEFLDWAATQDEAYEFVDGKPRPLWPKDPITGRAGGTVFHHVIQSNCAAAVRSRRPLGCLVAADARVELADGSSRIPDVALFCGRAGREDLHLPNPVLLIEVLSATTADYDRGAKLDGYKEVATVREVWLVDSERRRVTVWCRGDDAGRPWHADEHIGSSVFASGVLGGEIPLAEIYADVEL